VETKPHREAELKLASQLIGQIASTRFQPEKYEDEVRKRITKLVQGKIKGHDIAEAPDARPRAEVIDLMDALKASLGGKAKTTRKKKKAPAKVRRAGRAARRSA
jgi:DNA end-binding protein Ku